MNDMEDFLGKQIADAYEKDHRFDAQLNSALRENVGAQLEHVAQLRASQRSLESQLASLRRRNEELEKALKTVNRRSGSEAGMLEAALKEARHNRAEWAVSQKAFKELAIRLGAEQGLDVDAVIGQGNALKIGVVHNEFNREHGTNANGIQYWENEFEDVKASIVADRTFAQDFRQYVDAGVLYRIGDGEPTGWQNAFDQWLRLAREGKREAQYNVGWCYLHGKVPMFGDRFLTPHGWLWRAFEQGEPRSAQSLYWLHVNNPFHEHQRDSVHEECLQFGLGRQDAWALAVQRELSLEAELERQREEERETERADFEAARQIVVARDGVRHSLDRLARKRYAWMEDLERLVRCKMWLQYDNIVKPGGLLSLAKQGELWFHIENMSDRPLHIAAGKAGGPQRPEALAYTEIEPGSTVRYMVAAAVPVTRHPLLDAATGQARPVSVFMKASGQPREYQVHVLDECR